MSWELLQREISECQGCKEIWKTEVVNSLQMGEIPIPPENVRILFVGVAPTAQIGRNKGSHFYSNPKDNLRGGLFKLLQKTVIIPFQDLDLDRGNEIFHAQNFFFVHAAKIRPISLKAPPIDALVYCARQHLQKEICALKPKSICFLGKNNLAEVTQALFKKEIGENPLLASLNEWKGWVTLAPQPIRGHEKTTYLTIKKILKLTEP